MKVWLVTTGSYSDYRVEAVYDDEESAVAAQKVLDGDDEVEEYEVCPKGFLPYVELRLHAVLVRDEAGAIRELPKRWPTGGETIDKGYEPKSACKVDVEAHLLHPGSTYDEYRYDRISIRVHGTDHERVRKVFTEQRAMALANFDVLIEHERIRRRVSLNIK